MGVENNEISTGKKSIGEFAIEYQNKGYGGCIPVIDGVPQPQLMFGYVSESDKKAAMQLLEEALLATGGNLSQIPTYIRNAVCVEAHDIHPNEAVKLEDGHEIMIDYSKKTAYLGTDAIANLDDITCELPEEAVKVMLLDRAKNELERRRIEMHHCCCSCDDDEDYDDGYNDGYDEGYSEGYGEGYADAEEAYDEDNDGDDDEPAVIIIH